MPRHPKEQKSERRNVQGEKSRLNILRVSARLFAQRGYDDVSIRDIAEAVNIVPSLIIHHFGSKAALYRKTVNHFLGDGEIFMRGTAPLANVDPTNKQAAANAIAESLHIFFELWHGPHRIKHLDRLLLQVVFGRGSVDVPLALDWIRPSEKIFEDFFRRVGNLTPEEADVRMEIFFSHIFYPAVIRNLLLTEHDWTDYPEEFFVRWQKTIAFDFCRGLGLPDPIFDWHAKKSLKSTEAKTPAHAPVQHTHTLSASRMADVAKASDEHHSAHDPRLSSTNVRAHIPAPSPVSATNSPLPSPFPYKPAPPVPPQ
jgi:AcrR family transcriptional regulator